MNHMSLKEENSVRILELVVLHRNLKRMVLRKSRIKLRMVVDRSCLLRVVLHKNQSGLKELHKSLKGLTVQGCFRKSLLLVVSCMSR